MQKAKPFLALLLCLGLAACLRQTPSFPVSEQEQTQDDQTLKIMYETRAADINGLQADTVDYNRTHGRTETKDYLKNKEFRLNMVGYRILIAAYPMCPSPRKSRSMMVGISGKALARPVVNWAITPFGQADKATLKLGDEILDMGGEAISVGTTGAMRARAVLADYANRMAPLRFSVRRDGEVLNITQQPQRFCSYEFVLEKNDSYNAFADDKSIHVYTRVFDYLATDDELAFLIGHETAHNIMRHIPKERVLRIVTAISRFFVGVATLGNSAAGDVGGALTLQGFSRDLESEADYVGVYLAAAAGYDPAGALSEGQVTISTQSDFITGSGDEDPSGETTTATIWASHPPGGERYTQLRKAVEQIKQKQAAGLPILPNFND